MKKKHIKELKRIAPYLPKLTEVKTMRYKSKFGSELLTDGVSEDESGNPITPDKMYRAKDPVTGEVSHVRKMKELYKRGGEQAVSKYLDGLKKLQVKHADAGPR